MPWAETEIASQREKKCNTMKKGRYLQKLGKQDGNKSLLSSYHEPGTTPLIIQMPSYDVLIAQITISGFLCPRHEVNSFTYLISWNPPNSSLEYEETTERVQVSCPRLCKQ